jgi:hypothetical protein
LPLAAGANDAAEEFVGALLAALSAGSEADAALRSSAVCVKAFFDQLTVIAYEIEGEIRHVDGDNSSYYRCC